MIDNGNKNFIKLSLTRLLSCARGYVNFNSRADFEFLNGLIETELYNAALHSSNPEINSSNYNDYVKTRSDSFISELKTYSRDYKNLRSFFKDDVEYLNEEFILELKKLWVHCSDIHLPIRSESKYKLVACENNIIGYHFFNGDKVHISQILDNDGGISYYTNGIKESYYNGQKLIKLIASGRTISGYHCIRGVWHDIVQIYSPNGKVYYFSDGKKEVFSKWEGRNYIKVDYLIV